MVAGNNLKGKSMNKKKHYVIYQVTNLLNGKIYIGKHETFDIDDDYMGSGKLVKRAIEKYGIENFKKEILFDFETEEEMNLKEKEIVNEEFLSRDDVYNLMTGGVGDGFSFVNTHHLNNSKGQNRILWERFRNDKEFRQQHRRKKSLIAKKFFEEHPDQKEILIKRISRFWNGSFRGKHHSDESKRKIGEANSFNQRGSKNSNYGKHWWKDPNDKSKSMSIKEGDPVPEGWVRGRWF